MSQNEAAQRLSAANGPAALPTSTSIATQPIGISASPAPKSEYGNCASESPTACDVSALTGPPLGPGGGGDIVRQEQFAKGSPALSAFESTP